MYGLMGKIIARPGDRDALIAILLEGSKDMPGCLSYVVAYDPTEEDAVWVTEVWDSRESHRASLSLPHVRRAIMRGKAFIAGFGERFETEPVGGHGLIPVPQPPASRMAESSAGEWTMSSGLPPTSTSRF